jgi:tetracycline repressor-like protein
VAFGEKISETVNAAIAGAGEEVVKQMRAAVECSVRLLAENPSEARILIVESSGLGPSLEAIRRKIIDSHARSVEQAIAQLHPSGRAFEPELLARCWVGSVYESVYHWLEQPSSRRHSPAVIAHTVAEFNLRGIGAI